MTGNLVKTDCEGFQTLKGTELQFYFEQLHLYFIQD
jgi:hypothetical protein